MKLSFKQYINEGLIKLPHNLKNDITQKSLKIFLSTIKYLAERDYSGLSYSKINSEIAKTLKEYKIGFLDENEIEKYGNKYEKKSIESFDFDIKWNELPESYYKKLLKIEDSLPFDPYPEKNEISTTITFKKSGDDGSYSHVDNTINLNVNNFIEEDNLIKSLENTEKLIALIEHEMMHMIQFLLLEHFHEKQVEFSYSDESGMDDANYINSQAEYHPLIKTAIGEWKAMIKKLDKKEIRYNRSDLLEIFLSSKETINKQIQPSMFFKNIKKISIKKWKNACKIFYKELS